MATKKFNPFSKGAIKIQFNIPNIKEAERHLAELLGEAMDDTFKSLVREFGSIIIDPLLFGGPGWKPFIKTAAWKWINSPRGYAQLGFSSTIAPFTLISALRRSWSAKAISRRSAANFTYGIEFSWANIEDIYRATVHPAAGKGGLRTGFSWFEWVYAGLPMREEGFKFKKTGPAPGVRSSSIAGAEAGRMTTGGFWEVPPRFRVDIDKLWERNERKISMTIEKYIADHVARGVK